MAGSLTLTTTQKEYWYTIIKGVLSAAGFTFSANRETVESVTSTTSLYMIKDSTISDNYVTIIQYHINASLLAIEAIVVGFDADKVTVTIDADALQTLISNRNNSYSE